MNNTTALLLETIKIEEGKISNIKYHQERCNQSRRTLFHTKDILDLTSHIHAPKQGLYRCRILYDQNIKSIEYIPYTPKKINTLKIISSSLKYSYKYAQRQEIDKLLLSHHDVDDIIIEQNGLLTDTSIANIAFYKEGTWFTPNSPLLKGTMRAKLLDEGFLKTIDISASDLNDYSQVALMNAMIGFKILTEIHIQDTEGKTYDY